MILFMKKYNFLFLSNINNILLFVAVQVVFLYSLYDTYFFRVTGEQKNIAGLLLLICVSISAVGLLADKKKKFVYQACGLLLIFCAVGVFSSIFNNEIHMGWFLSDVALWLLLCSFIILFSSLNNTHHVNIVLSLMILEFWFCGLIGFLWGERLNGRFEAPVLFVVAGLPLMLVYARSYIFTIGVIAHLASGYFCFASGDRTATLVWCFFSVFSIYYWVVRSGDSLYFLSKIVLLFLVSIICFLSFGFLSKTIKPFFQTTRIYNIVSSGNPLHEASVDNSVLRRIDEVKDSLQYMEEDGSILRYVFGFGHGAAFVARLAQTNSINMDRAGKIHNIHFGPMLVFFRYGIIGLLFYLIFLVKVFATFIELCVHPGRYKNFNNIVLSGTVITYTLSGFMRNEFANPLFLLLISLYLTQINIVDLVEVIFRDGTVRKTA